MVENNWAIWTQSHTRSTCVWWVLPLRRRGEISHSTRLTTRVPAPDDIHSRISKGSRSNCRCLSPTKKQCLCDHLQMINSFDPLHHEFSSGMQNITALRTNRLGLPWKDLIVWSWCWWKWCPCNGLEMISVLMNPKTPLETRRQWIDSRHRATPIGWCRKTRGVVR